MGHRNSLKILILVYLVNQNIITGSAECTSSNSVPTNPTLFNAIAPTSSPRVSFQQNERAAQAFIPSEQINFRASPQNSKNNAASSKLTLQNSNPKVLTAKASLTSASKPSLISSLASKSTSANSGSSKNQPGPEPGRTSTVNDFSGTFNIARSQNQKKVSNSNSVLLPTEKGSNTVISTAPQSLNRAEASFKFPVQFTSSSLSQNTAKTGKPSTVNIVNTNFNVASSKKNENVNTGSCANTNGPFKIAPGNFGSSLFSPAQNDLNTIISSAPKSLNKPVQFTLLTSGQNSAKTNQPSTFNINDSNCNIISSQGIEASNLFLNLNRQTGVDSENAVNSVSLPTQNRLNLMNLPSLQSLDYPKEKSPAQFMTPFLNTFTENTWRPTSINFLPTNFNNAPKQDQTNFITNTNVQKAEPFTSTGSLNSIPSSTPTSSNYIDLSASQASITNFNNNYYPSLSRGQCVTSDPTFNPSSNSFTNTNSNIFSPNTLPLNQVPNPLPNIKSIPTPKPFPSSSSNILQFSPASFLQNNYPQNNINSPHVSSDNSIIRSTEKPLPPKINNCLLSPENTIPKAGLSEKAASEKTDPSRVLMEKFKANMALNSPIESNIRPNLSNMLNEGTNPSQSQQINNPSTENSNIPSLFSKSFNLIQSPSCNLASNSQSKVPNTVNLISPSSSPVSSLSASAPATYSQCSQCSQFIPSLPSNLLQLNFGTISGDASSSNLLSFSPCPSCTLSNIQNDVCGLDKSQPFNFPFSENDNKPLIVSNSLNPQQSSSCSSSPSLTLINLPRSVPPSTSTPSVNSQICNCQLNTPVSNNLQLTSLQQLGTLPSSNVLSSNSPSSSCLCQNIPSEGTNPRLLQPLNTPCAENNCNQRKTPVSNNLQLSSLQQLGSLPSSNKLSSSSPLSSCLCQNIPNEDTNSGLSQLLKPQCAENNCIPLLSCNSFNTQQASPRKLKSEIPHTLNIISSNTASSISAPAPSQNSVSVCTSQRNTPVISNVLPLNFVQNCGGTTSLSSSYPLPSNMDTSKLNLATNAACVSVSNNGFNACNQPSSYSGVPVTYQQVSTSIPNDVISAFSGTNTIDSVSNPIFAYSRSMPIVSNLFTSNVAAPFMESIPNALPAVNLSPLEPTETLSSSPCIIPINYVTSHISSPILDSYNAWVPSLVESFLTAFEPQTLLEALLQNAECKNPSSLPQMFSSPNDIGTQTLESLFQDSQSGYSSPINPIISSHDFDTQFIQYLLQDSPLFYAQNLPLIIDNEPIVLGSLPTEPQFTDYSILPNYEQLDSSDYLYADSPIVLPTSALSTTCSSSFDCNSSSFPTYLDPLPPQIIIDDNGSIDSSSAEEFIKWTILTELCNRSKLDPMLALALGSYL